MQHEHLYRLAVEQVADYAIFMIDPHGRVASWNAGVRQVLRWDEADWVGQPFSVIFTPEDVARGEHEAELEEARRQGCAEDDRWHVRRDGTTLWAGGITTALRDEQGNVSGFLKVMRDLTERKRADDRQATQLAVATVLAETPRLEDVVPKLLDAVCRASGWRWGAVWRVDRAADVLRFVDCWKMRSDALQEFEELEEFEQLSRQLTFARGVGLPGRVWDGAAPVWVTDVSREANFSRREAAARAGLHGALCFPVSSRGEVLAVMEFFGGAVRPPDDALLGMMSVVGGQIGQFLDRKLTEDRLRAEEARHAASVRAALDCIVSMDHLGRVTEWNPAAERTFGYARAEALGLEMASLIIPPPLREAHRAGLARHLATGEGPVLGKRFEITAVRKDGTEFPIELTIIRLPADGPPAFTGYIRDIGDQKRADEARRMSEFRWQRLVEQSPLSTQVFDPDGLCRQVNRAWERLWGVTLADLPGYNILQDQQLVDRGVMPAIRRAFDGEAATAEPIPYTPDRGQFAGQARWCGAYVYPVKDDAGHIEEVVLVHNDVTEQRLAEEALRQSEQRLRSLVEQSAAGIVQADLDGRVAFANDRFCQIVGYPREEVLGVRVHDLTHPDDLAETTRRMAAGASTGEEYTLEKRYIRRDGSTVWVTVSASVLKDGTGQPQAIMGVVLDVSDRKRVEAALREGEAWLRLAVAIAQMGTFKIDLLTNAVTVNDAGRDMYGWPPGEPLTFAKVQSHFHPDDRDEVLRRVGEAFRPDGPGEFEVEHRIVRTDGATRWIRVRGRALFEAVAGERRAVHCVGTYLDITGRKEADQQRERLLASERAARAEAERASRMKDEFLATLSHELRTPLNAILGWAQILAGGTRDADDLAEGLRTIERNARAQTQIIEDLLDMSRIISGKVRLDVQRVDLAGLVCLAVETAKPSAQAKGVRLQAVLDPHAGPVSGDPGRLQQVMWNLLSNAVKFTPRGGRVQVLLERVNSHLEVSVVDTGEGIDREFQPFVFDRFRQADASSTRRHGGLGIGLSIVKQLVELHGGTIRVKSPGVGQGATFTVSLPLTVLHPEPEAAEPRRHPRATAPASAASSGPAGVLDACVQIAGIKVLVVDDEADARAVVRRLLEDCQGQVVTAASAAEAIGLLKSERPDVLLCDIGMPGEDGYALIARIRSLAADEGGRVPAAALTAYARAEDRVRAVLAGFQMHLAKPVEPAELIATVASLAGRTAAGPTPPS